MLRASLHERQRSLCTGTLTCTGGNTCTMTHVWNVYKVNKFYSNARCVHEVADTFSWQYCKDDRGRGQREPQQRWTHRPCCRR